MEQEFLKSIVDVQPTVKGDVNAPYSFLEWSQSKPAVLEKDLFLYYNRYVIEWFRNNKENKVSTKFLLRQKYLFLLDQLQLFFTTEEKNTWYDKINLADEKELLLGIPYFAKKLKKIALYYLKLRKRLKNVKIRYNSIGTIRGIEQEIYQHILENFSSENEEFDPGIQSILPSLSSLKAQLVVKVEELYDDGEYLDKSPYAPLSGYVDIFHQATAELFSSKGIVLSSDDWLFNTFSFPTSSTVESFVSELTSNILEPTDEALYKDYVEKFLAEDKYNLEFLDSLIATTEYQIFLQQGNNYFFYPYGTTDTSLSIEEPLPQVSLSSMRIGGATAGLALSAADTIFVRNGDDLKAAWLYSKEYNEENETVLSLINKNTTTSFIFPFPGYGLSAEDIDWTGSTFQTEDEYQFLPPATKASVNEAYWSQVLPADSTTQLQLNETTLVDSGAKAGKTPDGSDNIFIRAERDLDTTVPRGSLSGAWLYRFEKAALPISSGFNNTILWPYSRVDQISGEGLLNYLSTASLTSVCSPVPIQNIDSSYFVAASSIELADKIYKVENYKKTNPTDATECCWLSSAAVVNGDYKYFNQTGVSYLFNSGSASKFVWTGPLTPLSSIFADVPHDSDCPFLTTKNKSADWESCTCKQTYYSPYGHSGLTFKQNNQHADYICESPVEYSTEFDLQTWKDSSQQTFETSNRFAWYKTVTSPTWGGGTWNKANGDVSTMVLEPGKAYIYRRADSRVDVPFPPYAVFKKFENTRDCFYSYYNTATSKVKWIAAKKNDAGEWVSTDEESTTILNPGDFLNFERAQSTTSFYLSTVSVEQQSENRGSVWAALDFVALDSGASSTTINWPFVEGPFLLENYGNQVPSVSFQSISAILAWKIQCDENPALVDILESPYTYSSFLSTKIYQNIFSFTFVPPQTGTYSISVTAVDNDQNIYTFPDTNVTIPKLSVVPQYSIEKANIEFETPSSSILLEHALSGWNYTVSDVGAKPYWAVLDSEKSLATKSKGIKEWGYSNTFFDSYIPNVHPAFAPLTINYGDVIEYHRRNSRSFYWNQPIVYKTFDGVPQWCVLNHDTSVASNLSSVFDASLESTLKVFPTLSATDIVLSNNMNGMTVEIFYNALSSFVWVLSTESNVDPNLNADNPSTTLYYNTEASSLNLQNRFYPTVAVLPTLDKTYSQKDSGSYFTVQNLGASQYINTNFVANLKTTELTGTYISEDTTIHIGGRGLTYSEQPTLYDWEESNEWLKEPPISNGLAGSVKKELTKTLQTFIPYQTNVLETSLGLVESTNTFSPWGGTYADQWIDKANEPIGFTGVRNVSAWQESQELSKTQQALDAWVSDIYGNQYGLFKNLSGVSIDQRPHTPGELWVKTNNGSIKSATKTLSALFEQFSSNETIYNQLTGKQILDIDCFFDTLMVCTSSVFVLSRVVYDYSSGQIEITTDTTRSKELSSNKFRFEQTWFLPQEKAVSCFFTELTANYFFPALYYYDLNTSSLEKEFPIKQSDINTLETSLSAYTPIEGRLSYSGTTRTFGITYLATDANEDIAFINIKLKRLEDLELESIEIFENRHVLQANTMPPIVLTNYLSAIPVTVNSSFSIAVSSWNTPTSYEIIDGGTISNQISVNSSGTFTGTLTATGLYHVQYSISNEIGSTLYSLTLSAS